MNDRIERSLHHLLRVVVFFLNGSQKESILFHKWSRLGYETQSLKEDVVQHFQLPPSFQCNIIDKGIFSSAPNHLLDDNPRDEGKTACPISSASLDTRKCHLFHVLEVRRMIQVRVHAPDISFQKKHFLVSCSRIYLP